MRLERRALVSWLVALAACAPATKPPLSPTGKRPVPFATPDELFPSDLDVIARIDVAKLRRTLGEEVWARMTAGSTDLGVGRGDDERALFVRALGAEASTLWIGLRTLDADTRDDAIVAASGDLDMPTLVTPRGGAWGRTDVGAPGVAVLERTPRDRGGPAMGVLLPGRGVVLASTALVDALARVLRDGPDPARLDPPADGVIGVAARLRGGALGAARKLPKLAVALADLARVRGVLDVDGGLLRVDLVLSFAAPDGAERAVTTLEKLRAALAGEDRGIASALAAASRLERAGDSEIILRVRAAGDLARRLLGS